VKIGNEAGMAESRRSFAARYRLEAYATLHPPKDFGAEDHRFASIDALSSEAFHTDSFSKIGRSVTASSRLFGNPLRL
jgi:hypothetical protein